MILFILFKKSKLFFKFKKMRIFVHFKSNIFLSLIIF